jgi:6-phosphogluconolactonase (cycloisomerase 2 family)
MNIDRRSLLKMGGLLAVWPQLARAQGPARFAYVGAFTTAQRKGHGDGITVFRLGADSAWTHEQTLAIANPSFFALDRDHRRLYAAHADVDEVSAYAIDVASGHLTLLNRQSCGGMNPVHLAVAPGGRHLVTANYSAGSVAVLPLDGDGRPGPLTDLKALSGTLGPNRAEQAGPHPHQTIFDPSGNFLLVPDKGLDCIFSFRLGADGKLRQSAVSATPPGQGPRHLAFHPGGKLVYVLNEIGSSLALCRYDAGDGSLAPLQSLSTVPADFAGVNAAAEIALTPSGRFVYASNRGHDSIAMFAADGATGVLRALGWADSGGKTPRFCAIDGGTLFAANQDSDSVQPFAIDQGTGWLRPAGPAIAVKTPVAIAFL